MGLLNTVRDLFTKTEVTEETFEYESIDHFLAEQQETCLLYTSPSPRD